MLLPPNLDQLLKINNPVRVIHDLLSKADIQPLLRQCKSGGASGYPLGMLLKVLLYAYINNIYSSRKIEEAPQQNIHFMWLSGMIRPDHITINRFRSEKLKELQKKILVQGSTLTCSRGIIKCERIVYRWH